jgi:hypothetical protein
VSIGYGQLEHPPQDEQPNHQKNGKHPPQLSTKTSVVLQAHSVMLGTSVHPHDVHGE